jgi:hypothetical protein
MKKTLLLFTILSLKLIGCPATNDPVVEAGVDATDDVLVCDDVVEETDEVITRDNWQLVLPVGWTEQTSLNPDSNVVLLASNESAEGLCLLTKEPYTDSFDQFAIETIRGLRGQGAEVLTTESTSLNDEEFVYVKTQDQGLLVDTWVTTKDGFGYSLNCGGMPGATSELSNDCQTIADSFKLK